MYVQILVASLVVVSSAYCWFRESCYLSPIKLRNGVKYVTTPESFEYRYIRKWKKFLREILETKDNVIFIECKGYGGIDSLGKWVFNNLKKLKQEGKKFIIYVREHAGSLHANFAVSLADELIIDGDLFFHAPSSVETHDINVPYAIHFASSDLFTNAVKYGLLSPFDVAKITQGYSCTVDKKRRKVFVKENKELDFRAPVNHKVALKAQTILHLRK